MNLAVDLQFTKDEFLRWVQDQEHRFELSNGKAVMMHGGTRGHAQIILALAITLSRIIDRSKWSLTASDLAVEIQGDIRYPDIVVEPAGLDSSQMSTDCPALVAEVLSTSSLALDLNVKAREYLSLPSLQAYLVAAQDEARNWLWERGKDGEFPNEPVEVHGKEKSVALHCFGVSVSMAEIYLSLPGV